MGARLLMLPALMIQEAIQEAFRDHLQQHHHRTMITNVAQNEHVLSTPTPMRKLGPRLKDRPEKVEEIKALWIAGERNRRVIARKIGISRDQVGRWVKAALESIEHGRIVMTS